MGEPNKNLVTYLKRCYTMSLPSQNSGGRSSCISEFEINLVYRLSSGASRATEKLGLEKLKKKIKPGGGGAHL